MSIWLMTGWKWSGRSVYLRDCIRTIQRFYVTLRKILNQRGMLLRSFDNIHEKEIYKNTVDRIRRSTLADSDSRVLCRAWLDWLYATN